MPPLPRHNDQSPPDVFDMLLVFPMENVTKLLRRGAPFTEADVEKLEKLRRRSQALVSALDDRLKLLEDDK